MICGMKKNVIKTVIVHVLTFAFMLVGSCAEMLSVRPFGYGLHLSVLLAGGNPLASAYYLAAALIAAPGFEAFAFAGGCALTGALCTFVISSVSRIKRKRMWRYITHLPLQSALHMDGPWNCPSMWIWRNAAAEPEESFTTHWRRS